MPSQRVGVLRHNTGKRTGDIWSSKLPDNIGFKNRMTTNFGNEAPHDNYEKNRIANDNQIGPKKENGSF